MKPIVNLEVLKKNKMTGAHVKRVAAMAIALLMALSVIPASSESHAADKTLDTTISGVKIDHYESYKNTIKDKITISPAYGRSVLLYVYNSYQKKWEYKGKYKTAKKKASSITITYPSAWRTREYATWLIKVPERKMKVNGSTWTLKEASVMTHTRNNPLKAKSAVVLDAKTGLCVYAKHATDKRKVASMTKMMTMIVVSERKAITNTTTINQEAIQARWMSGGMGLKKGDVVTIKDLMYCTLLPSANDAAAAAAVSVSGSQEKFRKLMKKKARSIGAVDTTYKFSFGDWYGDAKSTAFDQALIGREFMTSKSTGYVRKVVRTRKYKFTTRKYKKTYTVSSADAGNQILGQLGSIGIKTGYNPPAGRCFTNAWYHKGRLYISVVMGEPSGDQMWTDVKKLTRMSNYLVDHKTSKLLVKKVGGK